MVLYHLHDPTAPAFTCTCNVCAREIQGGEGFRCTVCADFNICNCCAINPAGPRHDHPMARLARDIDERRSRLPQEQLAARNQGLHRTMAVLQHASECHNPHCGSNSCSRVRAMFNHALSCTTKLAGQCPFCRDASEAPNEAACVPCPPGVADCLLGDRNRSLLRKVESLTKTTIQQARGQALELHVRGSSMAQHHADQLIRALGDARSAVADPRLFKPAPIIRRVCRELGIAQTLTVKCEGRAVSAILGPKGSIIRGIERETVTSIVIDRRGEPCVIYITGQARNANQAFPQASRPHTGLSGRIALPLPSPTTSWAPQESPPQEPQPGALSDSTNPCPSPLAPMGP
ncbi:hypothetical protein D9Q98_002948 [Chlorella vulgaris]|uniref:histone acetyltransferase n=1 Tax=Chlorella vulgaris TaxID=3077 RepID=A0A9D4TUQ3_CHLVU|nr:hypothetical protein D9Q98_002948 [Chlorella vulgaris]